MATDTTKQAWARGGTVLAGTLMLIIGAYQIFLGITAIVRSNFVVVTPNNGYYTINRTGWGWVQLGIGIVVLLAGLFLFTGSTMAKIVGIAVVALSALGNFFLIPYYPVWALLLIAVDIFAIWAIATMRQGEVTGYAETGMGAAPAMSGAGTRGGEWPGNVPPTGRHWAPENVKEGTGQPTGQTTESAEEARMRAEAAARGMGRTDNNPPQG